MKFFFPENRCHIVVASWPTYRYNYVKLPLSCLFTISESLFALKLCHLYRLFFLSISIDVLIMISLWKLITLIKYNIYIMESLCLCVCVCVTENQRTIMKEPTSAWAQVVSSKITARDNFRSRRKRVPNWGRTGRNLDRPLSHGDAKSP